MPTFWLTMTSMSWSVVFGMGIGVLSAVWRNRWPDRVGMTLAVSGISFPAFALGMVLMQVFAVQLNWLPTVGADTWKHYILPSLTLGAAVAAIMARFTRSSFVDILQEDYIRTARAKGLSEPTVVAKHGLRNALIDIVLDFRLEPRFADFRRELMHLLAAFRARTPREQLLLQIATFIIVIGGGLTWGSLLLRW
jgi:glutathione transport system permease protein